MAKATKQANNGAVAAALAHIEDTSTKNAKHSDLLKQHILTQEETIDELGEKLDAEVAAHAASKASAQAAYDRDTGALKTKVAALEEKLRKVQATLA